MYGNLLSNLRVLIISNHFWPANFRINDLALGLVERGHDVTVYAGIPDYPEGRFYAGYGLFRRRRETYRGIKVIRFPLIPRGKGKPVNLVFNYISSAFFSSFLAPLYCRGKYDVIFVFDTSPITICLPAIVMKKLRSIPLILWVLDLWPESLSATGAVRSPWLLAQVSKLVNFIYRNCDRILISSRGFSENVRRIGGYKRSVTYFPNWVEPEYLTAKHDKECKDMPELHEGFRVLFAGNIGAAQDFETILSAAEQLVGYPDIHWIILGDGRRTEWVLQEVKSRGLERNFHLLGKFPSSMMPSFFEKADALLVTLRKDPIFSLTVPGKVQSYMASGRPVVAGMDGEGAQIIEEAQAGLTCPAESPHLLAEKVLELYRMTPDERNKLASQGRQYCLTHFDRDKLFDKLETTMKDLIYEHPESACFKGNGAVS